MSQTIDHRVVEMRFDNKQFETGAKQTMGTLARLKEALKLPDSTKALEGIDEATKNISLDGIAAGVDALNARFSTMGIVGMRVIQNITDGLMNKLNAAVNFVSDSIISGGIKRAMNIENAHFQLQALLKDETKVQAVMADAMESVDGTAYAYDEAAKAAAQFSASGIQAGEEMLGALKGITGVAAMTNSQFADISMIFTTVAGNGRLMGDQLLQLSSRGLNAASTLADYFKEVKGQSKMTEGTIRDMVSKGKISFKDFSDAMTWAFGDSAKRANETFTGAMSNMKSALARIGAGFISPLVEQNGELVNLFNALRIKINDVKTALVFDEQSSAISGMSKLQKSANTTGDSFVEMLRDGSMGFDNLTKAIIETNNLENMSDDVINKMTNSLKELSLNGENYTADMKPLFEIFQKHGKDIEPIRQQIADFVNGVNEGSIKVDDNTKKLAANLEENAKKLSTFYDGAKVSADDVSVLFANGVVDATTFFEAVTRGSADVLNSMDETNQAIRMNSNSYAELFKSGTLGYEKLVEAILKTNGIEEVTSESITKITEKLKDLGETGKLSGENYSLLMDEFVKSGKDFDVVNQQIAHFVDGVLSGEIKVSDSTKGMVESFEKNLGKFSANYDGVKTTADDIAMAFANGAVEMDIFTEAMSRASIDVLNSSSTLEAGIKTMFEEVKKEGGVTRDLLNKFSKQGLNAYTPLKEYIKGVQTGSIRATYAIRQSLDELSEGEVITTREFNKALREGAISADIFQAAMENAFGDSKALSKQFTDSFLDMLHKVVTAINEADMTKPMEVFYYGVESTKNLAKGLYSVLKPIGKAFADVFLDFNGDDVINFAAAIEELTAKMQLSEKGSKNLHDAFEGVFSVVRLLGDGFISLLKVFIPIEKPVSLFSGDLLDLAGNAGRALSKLTEWVRKSPDISKAYSFLSFGFGSATKKMEDFIKYIEKLINKTKNLSIVKNVIDSVKNVIDSVTDAFNEFGNSSKKTDDNLNPFLALLTTFFGLIKKTGPVVKTIFDSIGKTISNLTSSVSKIIGLDGFDSIHDLFNVAVLSGIGIQLSKFIENVNRTVSSAGGFFSGIKRVMGGVTKTFESLQTKLNAESLKSIAISIALISGSMVLLASIDSEKLTESLGAVTVLIGELTGVFVLLNKMEKIKKPMISSLNSLITMSISILILASALKKISNIDSEKLLGSLGGISLLLGEMTIIAIVLSKYGGKVKTGLAGIIAFSTAIYVLTASVEKLGELDVDTLTKGLISVGVLLAELAAFMAVMKFGKIKPSQSVGILILSAALLVLQKSVDDFGNMDVDKLIVGIAAIGGILSELALFSLAAGESKHILSSSVSVVIMAKALEMLEKPMTTFGNMSFEQIGKGLLAVGASLGEIVLAMRFMPKNSLKISIGLLAVGKSISIISDSFSKMGDMSWEEIARGMVALGGSMSILSLAMNTMKGTLGASIAMMIMSAALNTFVPTLKTLGEMSIKDIAKSLITLALSFGIIGGASALLSPAIPSMVGLSVSMFLLGAAAAAVGLAVGALSVGLATLAASGVAGAAALVEVVKILVVGVLETITESAVALKDAVKTIVLSICEVVIECVPEVVKTVLVVIKEVLKSLADNAPEIVSELLKLIIGIIDSLSVELPTLIQSVVNLFMQFFSGIIQALKGMDVNVLVDGIAGIGLITALMLALSAMAHLAPSAMLGVLAMGITIAELSLVLSAIGALAQIPGLKWLIGEGGNLLQGIGIAIGKFVGGIVGGFMGGISSQFPQIGLDLSAFMDNVQPFINGASKIDSSMLEGVNSLAKTILLLTAADVLKGLTSWLTGGNSLSSFGEELAAFGPPFSKFADDIKNIDPSSVAGAANAAVVLADMASTLPNSGGLAGKIFGENNLSDFGKELEEFGPYISSFANIVKDVKPESVTGAAQAAQIMADMANTLPNSGGLAAKIFGDNTLSAFGEELNKFGPYLASYAAQVKDVKPEIVQASANAAQIMADMASTLPNSGGLAALILGDNRLSDFGNELAIFGPLISKYAASVSGIDSEAVVSSANAAKTLSELANNLPNSGGLVSWFTGDNDISSFGESLSAFGDSLTMYYQSISGIDTQQLDSVVGEIRKLMEVATGMSTLDSSGMTTFSIGLQQMANVGVTSLIEAFIDSSSKVSEAVKIMLDGAISGIRIKGIIFTTEGTKSANAWIAGIKTKYTDSTNTGLELALKAISGIKQKLQDFQLAGQDSANKYLEGIKSKYTDAFTVGGKLSQSIMDGFKNSNQNFYTAGANAGQGYVEGLKSKLSEVSKISKQMASASEKSAEKELDEHSPSKKMERIGSFAGLGFIKGLVPYIAKAYESGKEMGENIVDGAKYKLSNISYVYDDLNLNPVISPTVDLSDVRRSAFDVRSMFNNAVKEMSADVGSISTMVGSQKSGSNSGYKVGDEKGRIVENKFNYTQNNYSPKALDAIDIYRNTNNQISTIRNKFK